MGDDSGPHTVSDKAAIDELGYAILTTGPLAMIARAEADLATPGLRTVLIDAANAFINRLITDSDCYYYLEGDDNVIDMFCTAYNGTVGEASNCRRTRGARCRRNCTTRRWPPPRSAPAVRS